MDLTTAFAGLDRAEQARTPPVETWHPSRVIDIAISIARDGSWRHDGQPIRRKRLTWLFSTILRRESDGRYFLVTPVEKCLVRVEDAPFIAATLHNTGTGSGQTLSITTNFGDTAVISRQHPIRFAFTANGGLKSYVLVRHGLEALFSRSLVHELAKHICVEHHDGADWFALWSDGRLWPVEPVKQPVSASP